MTASDSESPGRQSKSEPPPDPECTSSSSNLARWMGLAAAPFVGAAVYLAVPAQGLDGAGAAAGLSQAGRAVAGVGALMAVLWVTEALPIAATALIPIVLFPLLTGGEVSVEAAAAPYADKLIYLFMGGFMLAAGMQRWGLHRRIALLTILLFGTRPVMVVAGFMAASAFLSMWVSNTATVVMMLPIAMSVVELVRRELRQRNDPALPADGQPFNFAICLMLGTAYASSIGGIGTIIGTPPNGLLVGYLTSEHGMEISFVRWMGVGMPLVVVFLPLTWLLLTKFIFRVRLPAIPGGRELIRTELNKQGPISRGELVVLIVFLLTATAWITRKLLVKIELADGWRPLSGLTDAGIAIGAALLLFGIPVHPRRGIFALNWRQARMLPWGILILFGGGLSLASAAETTGVAQFIARGVSSFHTLPIPVLVLIVTAAVVFLTELTSNTATTATFLPILGAVAVGLGVAPALLVVPMAIGASCAFMMPVATPPNAIVFGSGEITIPQMCKAGLWLNLIGIALVMLLMYTVAIYVLGITAAV